MHAFKYWTKLIAAIALATCVVASVTAMPAYAEKRIALVIGNSSYKSISPLTNPKNDASLMVSTLKDVGFDVVSAIDVDYRGMRQAVRKFGKLLRSSGKDAVGLLYYAGHGVQARGENYLIPLGADIQTTADLEIEALSASNVLAQMEDAGNQLNLVILDACRNNPFKSTVRTAGRGLVRIRAASGSLVAFAAAPGQVAADGTHENSPYTISLVEAIRQPGLSVEQVFKRTRVSVRSMTGGRQTPWEESSLEGDFYFVPEMTEPSVAFPLTEQVDRQALFWNSVKDSDNPALLQIYIDRYPESTFAGLASAMMDDLKAKAVKREQERSERLAALTPPSNQAEANLLASPEKMLMLARRYESGDVVPQDLSRAAQLYRAAANKGHGEAAYRLGLLYYDGNGVAQSWAEATVLILGAIKIKHTPALDALLNREDLRHASFVTAIQRRLKALGYLHGNVDGRWGRQTSAAVVAFSTGRKPEARAARVTSKKSTKRKTNPARTSKGSEAGKPKKRKFRFVNCQNGSWASANPEVCDP